jgi:hypothetical protein
MSETLLRIAGFGLTLLLIVSGCNPSQVSCPNTPPAADSGPAAPMSGQSSVDIEMSRLYMIERIRSLLEDSQTGDAGAFVRSVDLIELQDANNRPVSILEIQLEPWLRGQSGTPASLQRFYRLRLKITPHLITPSTVSDQTRRKNLLCPPTETTCAAEQGALLTFDVYEMYNISFSRAACDTPDAIDIQIAPKILGQIAAARPLALPTEAISSVLAGATGPGLSANLVDVNVSTDGFLKIGLQYTVGTTHVFDRVTSILGRYPNRDWLVNIDTSILSSAVRARMLSTLVSQAPGSTITSFSTSFVPGEIQASGSASVTVPGICGSSALITISARNPTQMCRDATNTSAIVSWTDASTATGNVCLNLAQFWANINVGTVSGPPTVWPTLATVSFPVGDNDVFYGTDLDLDNAFAIVGRSTLMDRKAAASGSPRAAAPAKCPGVP